ncbi:serine proteinase stubble-like isoform X2 [Uranotaenia lowii]|uniref:serine proteinase stubble-like isoform X2 n=1 Tax=Uranotaenia lowii TaxID=190385 RepID=UPI0024793452|nr:serine proteinase stubble-like isoform X2 [Uranotaenia lowii]
MSSKPRRGTVRWNSPPPARSRKSKQSSTTSSTFRRLLPLLLSSLTVHLSHLFSLAHGNPLHPFSSTLSLGRNLRHLPCVVRSSGQEGVCMFAIDCFKANGTHLGVCIDKIFFGSCCQVNDDNLLFNHEITDNSIDHNHHSNFPVIDTNKKPVITETRFPTTAAPKNDTKYELVSTSSTTTHRTTSKINRRNSTTSAVPFRDDVPSTTEYQEFSTFQFVQSSKGPSRTTTKPNEKSTTRKPPPRNTTKPIKTRRPTPSRTNTKRPTTTQTVLLDTKQNSTALPSVNQRPVTSTDASSTGISRRPTTTAATTIRSTTVNSRRPTTTAPSSTTAYVEETTFPPRTRRPTTAHPTTAGVVPLTRPTNRRRPTLATSTAAPVTENDTTRAPRPRPRPTSQIVTTPATSLEHLLDDLISTTLKSSSAKVEVTYPITTVKVTEATTPTTTPKPASRKPTKTTSTTLSTTPTTTPTTTSTTTEQTTSSTAGSSKTTAPGRITPPADIDYQPQTSQTENIVDETTTGSGLVTWSSISVDSSSDKTVSEQASAGPTTSNSWILIHTLTPEEVLNSGVAVNQSTNHQPQQPSSASLVDTVQPDLTEDIFIPSIESLLPEAAYIYTIHDDSNNLTQTGGQLDLTSHSQITSSPSTEGTLSSIPSTAEVVHVSGTSSSTVPSTTASTTTTTSTSTSPATSPTTTTTTTTVSTSSVDELLISSSSQTATATESIPTSAPSTTTTTQTTPTTTTTTTESVSTTKHTTATHATSSSTVATSSSSSSSSSISSSSTITDTTTEKLLFTSSSFPSLESTMPTTEQEIPPATSTVAPEILIEISGPTIEKDTAPVRPDSTEPVTIEPVTEVTTLEGEEEEEEEGSEEGSGESEEESGEEEEEVSSSETLDTTSETIVAATSESDKLVNTTVAPELASSTINTTTIVEESTTIGTSTTLNITSSLQSIASMFNITTSSPGAPVRFPEDNKTAVSTVGYANVTTVKPTLLINGTEGSATTLLPDSTMPSLEGIDYRAVCGKRMFPEPRIVGGTKASFGRWPWQISLRQWRTSTYLHKCGAALLNENWAITAAHCVDNVPPSDLLLRLGEYDLALEEEPYGYQERRVQIVASHPQFDPRTFEYDLALLRFYEPVVFQPNIIPVCVPENDENFIGRTAFVTGWGRLYEDGPLPSVLQEVTVPVIENKICEAMYRSAGYIEHIPHIFICAGWKKGGYDSCEGDSGGPMVIQRGDKRFQLAGVISWGIGCAEANQPGVYTRISEFRDWINQILQF